MQEIEVRDKLNYICNKDFRSIVPSEESLLWSGSVIKINNVSKRQRRNFLISNFKVYNIGSEEGAILSFFTKKVKRSFEITEIKAITYGYISNTFILHLPKEYDYYLCTPDKDEFISYLLFVQKNLGCEPMKLYCVEDIDLYRYCRYEGQSGNKYPPVVPQNITMLEFEKLIGTKNRQLEKNIENTEVIISRNNDKVNENSFEILKTLGKGYFGTVFLVEMKNTEELFALKVISKLDIIKRNFFGNLKNEKQIMEKICNPFVLNLEYCFTNPSYVFFVVKFKQGGDLYYHIRQNTRFAEGAAKFYSAQILEGLCYLHSLNIMYRDLKPENVLLDEKGNCCLADFGISKFVKPSQKTNSFVGTPEYVAPEIIKETGHNKNVDIWCFGILLFEMVTGNPPFANSNKRELLDNIKNAPIEFHSTIRLSHEVKDLISKVN